MRYLLFHCLDETAELNPDDDSDVEGSAAAQAVAGWDAEMEARGVKLGGGRLRPVSGPALALNTHLPSRCWRRAGWPSTVMGLGGSGKIPSGHPNARILWQNGP